jgi:outer membrane receptor protein involved in Fe transport
LHTARRFFEGPRILWLIPLLFSLVWAACAQSPDTGGLEGTVLDPAGRAVPGATLVLVNPANGSTLSALSDASGHFRYAALSPATYMVRISALNLAPLEAHALVELGSVTALHVTLSLPTDQQSVEVKDALPVVDTSTPVISTTLDREAVDGLPSSSRRWSDFALLTPGVTPDSAADGLLSFRGVGALLNNNTVDGADDNQAFFSEERGRTLVSYSTSQASVDEFQVNTSNYSAEYGRAAGGVVNTVTRSGTNDLHGQLFFYTRNSAWGASNPFTTLTTKDAAGDYVTNNIRTIDTVDQGGFALGGPIRRDKLFAFLTFDRYSRDFPGIARAYTPAKFYAQPTDQSIATLSGRLGVSPTQALATYNQVVSGLTSLLGPVPRSATQNIFFPKIDWQASERSHFTFQYNYLRWNAPNGVQTTPAASYGVASFGNSLVSTDTAVARWAYFLSANLLSEMHIQYSRDLESQLSDPPAPFEQPLSQNIYGRAPGVSVAGSSYGFQFGKPAVLDRAAYPDEQRDEFVDSLTWVHGAHTFKAGWEYNYVNDYSDSLYDANGTYSYSSVINFVADYISPNHCDNSATGVGVLPCYTSYQQGIGPTSYQFQSADYAVFLSDEWKPRPRLTLSLGVRYEYEQLPNTNRALVNSDIPGTASLPHDKNNFGPRLGLAWDVFGSGHTVLRLGYGIYYGRIINSTAFTALTASGVPNSQRTYYYKPLDTGAPPFPYVFSSTPYITVAPSADYFDPRFQNPQIHQTEVSLEQQLYGHTALTVAYMGSYGRELPSFIDSNIDLSAVSTITYQVVDPLKEGPLSGLYTSKFFTSRINANYQQITRIFSETNSKYQAAVIKIDHGASRVLDLHASYTYSHAADYNQNATAFADTNDVYDPTNLSLEYGNSNYDIRNRLTGGFVLHGDWHARGAAGRYLLNGYSLASTAELRSGLPYSMHTNGSIPSLQYIDDVGRQNVLSGLGASLNGSGGDNRVPFFGRNSYHYPAVSNTDLRLTKRTPINERISLEVLAETFNLLNHQNVTSIDTTGYTISNSSSLTGTPKLTWQSGVSKLGVATGSEFGTVTNANNTSLYRQRQIQLSVRLHF